MPFHQFCRPAGWLFATVSLILALNPLVGAPNKRPGFIDLNLYPVLTDVKTDSVFTLNAYSKLSKQAHYFSLTNLYADDPNDEFSGRYSYYTEQNLRWALPGDMPLDLTVQYNLRSGANNDRLRFGTRWRVNQSRFFKKTFDDLHLCYSVNFHILQFDHQDADVWQIEHVFRKTFPELTERMVLSGFIDHTFNEDLPAHIPNNPIVAEAQLAYRLNGAFYLVSEYRINQYRRSDTNNLALGVEYLHKW